MKVMRGFRVMLQNIKKLVGEGKEVMKGEKCLSVIA